MKISGVRLICGGSGGGKEPGRLRFYKDPVSKERHIIEKNMIRAWDIEVLPRISRDKGLLIAERHGVGPSPQLIWKRREMSAKKPATPLCVKPPLTGGNEEQKKGPEPMLPL